MQGRWQHPAKKWPAAAQISTQLAAWVQVTLPKMSNRQGIHSPAGVRKGPLSEGAALILII